MPAPCLALIAAATSWQGSALRDEITTLAPCSARRSAMALPMPRDEPVMTATLPSSENNDINVSCDSSEALAHWRLRQTRFSESRLSGPALPLRTYRVQTREVNIPEFLKGENGHFL